MFIFYTSIRRVQAYIYIGTIETHADIEKKGVSCIYIVYLRPEKTIVNIKIV